MELADIHSFVMLCSITCHQKYVSGGLFSYRMSNFAFNKRSRLRFLLSNNEDEKFPSKLYSFFMSQTNHITQYTLMLQGLCLE